MRLITITGRKNVGKTTVTERLVREFTRRGLRVATIKHTHHDFQADREGTDSWRHRAAGSECALIVSGRQLGLVRTQADEQPLEALAAELCAGCDLVLAEGFKEAAVPRVEVLRRGVQEELLDLRPAPIAVVADFPARAPAPVFAPEDAAGLAAHLEARAAPVAARALLRRGGRTVALPPDAARALAEVARGLLAESEGAAPEGAVVVLLPGREEMPP